MTRINKYFLIGMLAGSVLAMSQCEDTSFKDEDNDEMWEREVSTYNGKESHNAGKDCGSCHRAGQNEYVFSVSGTVYQKDSSSVAPGSTVFLYTGPNGTGEMVLRLEVDRQGNFYTTEPLSRNIQELYPTVTGPQGSIQHMSTQPHTGSCNSCHGNTQAVIWVEP